MSVFAVAVVAVSSILLVLSSCEQDLQRTRSLRRGTYRDNLTFEQSGQPYHKIAIISLRY